MLTYVDKCVNMWWEFCIGFAFDSGYKSWAATNWINGHVSFYFDAWYERVEYSFAAYCSIII